MLLVGRSHSIIKHCNHKVSLAVGTSWVLNDNVMASFIERGVFMVVVIVVVSVVEQ